MNTAATEPSIYILIHYKQNYMPKNKELSRSLVIKLRFSTAW